MSSSSSDLDNKAVSRSTRERRIAYKRTKRLGTVCQIPCDQCFLLEVPCVKMSSGRGKLTCATCRKKGVPCVSMSYNAVEKAMDSAEERLKVSEEKRNEMVERLAEAQAEVRRNKRLVEFARKRAEEQFWCLERSLEERGEPNLFAQVREATEWEKELYGDMITTPPDEAAASLNG